VKVSNVILKNFGQRVRDLRKTKDISQEDLAYMADLDRAYLGRVERGEVNISLINISKISGALGTPTYKLLQK
jgi:transcriptional regulator with XRE-family HTH domain